MIAQQTGGIRRTTEDADEGENICEEKLNSKNSQALYIACNILYAIYFYLQQLFSHLVVLLV